MRGIRLRNAANIIQTKSLTITPPLTTTTTFNSGIKQSINIQHLDILSRYSRFYLLIEQLSPIINNLDRYISPLWLPFGIINCILCIIIYSNSQWRKSLKHNSNLLMIPYGYGSLSIYLLILSILHLVQCILVIIIDLDTPWDTGLLAINNLICPFIHCLWTGNRLAIILITITLGIETLVLLQRETNFPSNSILRWIIADGNHKKSIRISIGILLLAGIYSFIEIVYWRIQYYNIEYERIQSVNPFSVSSSSSPSSSSSSSSSPSSSSSSSSSSLSIESLKSLEPLARCEVAGGYQYWFSMKSIHRYDIFTEMDITKKTSELAASYFDYQWITGITIDCSIALLNICIGLAIIRAYFIDDLIIRPRYAESRVTISRRNQFEVLHISIICIIQGLCRLPNALFTMLDPLTKPGEMNLTDSEVLKDNTWQRFFLMLSAKVIGIEFSNFIAVLLLPICIGFCKEFRQNFYGLLKCKIPKIIKTTLLSLYPKYTRSRIITSSRSHLPDDSIPHHHHHHQKEQQQQHHRPDYYTGNNPKSYHDPNHHRINPLENHNNNTIDISEDTTSERYVPNCHAHKLINENNIDIHNETDLDTTYDNTKSLHQCDNQNHHHHHQHHHQQHHSHQDDLNSLKQYPINLHSNKQNVPYMKPICNLHDSIPNSLFCSNNKLSIQYYNHSKPNSLNNLYHHGNDCEPIQKDTIKSILEHRSYV
ncbi:unnamed protein product [Schistosoma rodhaini]|uniref:G-protein coupled receptors family 1 profile domain-containing protein n=1 Tax=Schistosoma mansoni TaxID=6183 RepID=A0A3Q0KMF5_SCHMA|nr:unnamed protein product [Schistosoma rodhaini]